MVAEIVDVFGTLNVLFNYTGIKLDAPLSGL
jgi:hypothetical protein